MNIFKKLFCKRKKEELEEQKEECWYNDVQEQAKSGWVDSTAIDAGALSNGNARDAYIVMDIARR